MRRATFTHHHGMVYQWCSFGYLDDVFSSLSQWNRQSSHSRWSLKMCCLQSQLMEETAGRFCMNIGTFCFHTGQWCWYVVKVKNRSKKYFLCPSGEDVHARIHDICIYIYFTVIYIYNIIVCIHFANSAPKSQDVLMHWSESMSYVEQLLRDQLVAAIGKARSGSKQSRWSP